VYTGWYGKERRDRLAPALKPAAEDLANKIAAHLEGLHRA
jgi:hypothetical protein